MNRSPDTLMRAATIRAYGPPSVVQIETLPIPVPRTDQVLITVSAAAVTSGDARLRAAAAPRGFGPLVRLAFGLRRPRNPIFGMQFAGTVATPAPPFATGTRVFGITGLRGGAHAETLCLPARGLILPTPDSLTDAEAAAFFFGGLTAAHFLIDKAALQPGQRLLINGATGAVGAAALQIARHIGAQITACCSPSSAALALRLGADQTHDYRQPLTGQWDVILDVAGTLPYAKARPLLAPGGQLLLVTATLAQTLGALLRPRRAGHRISAGVVTESLPMMQRLIGIHHAGGYRPHIGTTLPFEQIATAHAVAGSGHGAGNTVVQMDHGARN